MRLIPLAVLVSIGFSSAVMAKGDVVCTLVLDVGSGAALLEEGDCRSRVTPASTFKIPLAVIGYDTGFLKDDSHPVLSFEDGDPDWGGADWKRDTNPKDWLRYSVVWYSQRITRALGRETLERSLGAFGYGNADMSGDPGFDNGLERAWIASSLQISPREQAGFLRRLVDGTLPAGAQAMAKARGIVESRRLGDWVIHGKTGAAFPRNADRSFDYARGWGWYVGWAEKGEKTVVFARLIQTKKRSKASPGVMTRDALLEAWPVLSQTFGR